MAFNEHLSLIVDEKNSWDYKDFSDSSHKSKIIEKVMTSQKFRRISIAFVIASISVASIGEIPQ